ncbi:MAG: hypothetical protein ACK5Y2_08135 [Bdellovibrionales bacterium]
MIFFPIALVLLFLSYGLLSRQVRSQLYREIFAPESGTRDLILKVLQVVTRNLSPQMSMAQGLLDFELKIRSFREALMIVAFQKMGLIFVGALLALTLEVEAMIAVFVVASAIFLWRQQNPSRWIQILLLGACFWGLFHWAYRSVHSFLFLDGGSELAFFLADGRLGAAVALMLIAFFVTLVLRFEFWTLFLAALLYFAGAIPVTNGLALILGEELAWVGLWWWGARSSSSVSRVVFRQVAILTAAVALGFFVFALMLRGAGLFESSIWGSILDKKIFFFALWSSWQLLISIVLSVWGHFRANSSLFESSDLEPISFPPWLMGASFWGYKGWLPEQRSWRRQRIEQKVQTLQSHLKALSPDEKLKFPPGFLLKTQREVESLKRLLGALPPDSV